MHPALSSALRSPRFAPLPESSEAALRLLADGNPGWPELAAIAARDAAFTHALLAAAPLTKAEHGQELALLLSARLEQLGSDLLRAWLLHVDRPAARARSAERVLTHALMTAECALHLAIETTYPRPQEAYLAGLCHDLGRLWLLTAAPDYAELSNGTVSETALVQEERKRYGQDHAALAGRLVAEGGAPPQVVDAVALHHMMEEQAAAAHPLARLLWSAEILASEEHDTLLTSVSRITGLGEATLLSLRTDVAFLTASNLRELGIGQGNGTPLAPLLDSGVPASALPLPGAPLLPAATSLAPNDYWRTVALQGLLRGGFGGVSTDVAAQRLRMACRLLFGREPPFLVGIDPRGQLVATTTRESEEVGRLFDELQLQLDDEASVVALAARTGATTSHFPGPHSPGRSSRDWHLARWIGAPGLLCLPCHTGQEHYVAVFGIDEHLESAAPEQALMAILAASAATVLQAEKRQRDSDTALQASMAQHYREHARRIVHEVNNPLTVIRSYLGMIGQRLEHDEALRNEMGILHTELDRVGSLLQGLSQAPQTVAEAPRCSVAEVLLEMRALYGEPLFARRNIELDLRTVSGLPPAHMPPSVLKQVILNLFRNASEALLDGGKLTVSTPGTLIADGIPCMEIRLIDNGPGIPTERLAHLFESSPSAKPGHQGVGLSICRELLSTWHASIVCRSQSGTGTSFQIFIPLDQST
jgi:hypothetical protein